MNQVQAFSIENYNQKSAASKEAVRKKIVRFLIVLAVEVFSIEFLSKMLECIGRGRCVTLSPRIPHPTKNNSMQYILVVWNIESF